MKRSSSVVFRLASWLAVLGSAGLGCAAAAPNIIIIYTDDHGFTDLGVHGVDANVRTPVLDALARGGALMKHGYSTAPQCVPSRSGLLSGRIQNSFGTRQNGDIFGRIPVPLTVPTIAERLVSLGGYRTGMVGKWHLEIPAEVLDGDFPGVRADYMPAARGFQEYWYGAMSPYKATFDLTGKTLAPAQSLSDARNRVIVQGEAAQAFIQRNQSQPFFLYLALYGPHWPRIATTDSFYQNFPVLDYPNYSPAMDGIRRQGLALVAAVDSAVGGVVQKLRDLGLEENTVIFFAGDNGAPPKFWDGMPGSATLADWTGSENLPLRGEKGSLWEGGMKVPMFVSWKNHIPANQVIEEPVWTLDFTATLLKLAGGTIPGDFDGVDLLPRLTGQVPTLVRSKPLFWDWGQEIAMRKGDWKFHRMGNRKSLFNLHDDPLELYDLKFVQPAKFQELETEIMVWRNSLPASGQSALVDLGNDTYVTGAALGTPVDPRFLIPYTNAAPAAYPAPLTAPGDPNLDTDGDGTTDVRELAAGRDPRTATDLAFEFATAGDYEGWVPIADAFLTSHAVADGFLAGQCASSQGKFENYDFSFAGDAANQILVRIRSPQGSGLTFRWGTSVANVFAQSRTLTATYSANQWQTVVIVPKGHAEWDHQTITRMRLNPVNTLADFQVEWIRASTGDCDGDLLPDTYEVANGLDAIDPADGRADHDGDGYNRGQEYVFGTSDSDPASKIAPVLTHEGGSLRIQWSGVAGRIYQVMSSATFAPGSWTAVFDTGVLATNAPQTFTVPMPQESSRRFYRIQASLP